MVFHRRAGQRQTRLRLELLDRARADTHRIFDILRLVENREAERHLGEQADVASDQRIACQIHIHVAVFARQPRNRLRALGLRTLARNAAQLGREFRDFRHPVVHQRRRRNDDGGRVLVAAALGPQQQCDDLQSLAQAHVVGQNTAHMQPVERLHPHKAAHLVRAEHLVKRLGAGFAVVLQTADHVFHAVLGLDRDAAAFQQAGHIRRAVSGDFHHAAGVLLLVLRLARLAADSRFRHLAPLVHLRQIEERAVFETEILLAVAQRAQNIDDLRRGFAVFGHLQPQRAVLHAQGADKVRLARGHLAELVGAVDLRVLLHLVDALGQEAVNRLLSAENDAPLLHAEAESRQQVERAAFRRRVAQQHDALVAFRGRGLRREGVDFLVAVEEREAAEHQVVLPVEIRAHLQLPADDALGQRAVERHRSGAFQRGQQVGNHAGALLRVEAERGRRARPGLRGEQHADNAPLGFRQAQHVALAIDIRAVAVQHAQGFGHLRAHLQLAAAGEHAEEQLHLPVEHARHADDLFAEGDLKRARHQQLHQPRHKAIRHGQVFRIQPRLHELAFQLADVSRVLQKLDDLRIHPGEAHPFRLEHEALAEGDGRLFLQAAQKLRHALDDVHPLLPDAQGDAHRLLFAQQPKRDLHFQRRFHRQGALQRAHQRARVFARAAAAHLLDRAGGNGLHHRRRQMAARLMHVAEKVARAAPAQLGRRAHAHDAPRVAVHRVPQKTVFILEGMHAALTENHKARVIFLLRRDPPDDLHTFSHKISPLPKKLKP